MNTKQPKSYPEKPKKAPKPAQAYPASQYPFKPEKKKPKNKYPPKRYANEPESGYYPPYKKKGDRNAYYIYKQDLIQKGFYVYNNLKVDKEVLGLCDQFPECFVPQKRKVVIDVYGEQADELSAVSKSRVQGKEYLREELEHLMDNEDIPDWYFDAAATDKPLVMFDFASTVNRTKEVNKEISKIVQLGDRAAYEGHKNRMEEEIDFEELDKLLEKNFISARKEDSVDEEGLEEDLEAFEGDGEENSGSEGKARQPDSDALGNSNRKHNDQSANDSKNDSSDYFYNLQTNIKKMLFNKEDSVNEEDKDSEESFQESLAFESKRERQWQPQSKAESGGSDILPVKAETQTPLLTAIEVKTQNPNTNIINPDATNNVIHKNNFNMGNPINLFNHLMHPGLPIPMGPDFKIPAQLPSQIPVNLVNPLPMPIPIVSANTSETHKQTVKGKHPQGQPSTTTLVSNLPLNKLELENPVIDPSKIEEYKNITPEERESRKQAFLERYGYLDPIMCQIVYEILNSKKRQTLNKYSINGFNQKSVEKYCQNKYKIFSLYLQGDIISKVWLYKDKLGHVQGPFMSYDMDIWNGEGNYFSDELKIALMNSQFLPIQMYLDRAQTVIDLVQNFLMKNEISNNDPKNSNENNRQSNRKYTFHKKSEHEKEAVVVPVYKSPNELTSNFAENFPPLGDTNNRPKPVHKSSGSEVANVPVQNAPRNPSGSSQHGELSLLDTLRGTLAAPASFDAKNPLNFDFPELKASINTTSNLPELTISLTKEQNSREQIPTQPANLPAQQESPQPPAEANVEVKLTKVTRKEQNPVKPVKTISNTNGYNPKGNTNKKQSNKGKLDKQNSQNEPVFKAQPVEKVHNPEPAQVKIDGAKEMTDNIKSLLGLSFK